MSGIRIHHISERSCCLLIPHPGEIRRLGRKTVNKGRKPKDYPIHLDSEGNSIISETVWQRLQETNFRDSFIVLNEVKEPPTLTIGFRDGSVEQPVIKKQMEDAIRDIVPPGSTTYVRGYRG